MLKRILSYISIVCCSVLLLYSCENTTNPKDEDPLGANTNNESSPLITELNNKITPLVGSSPNLSDDDLNNFADFGEAKIVELGEATHGTKEFFQLKHRLFKYLV